jgi:hypothetical protein
MSNKPYVERNEPGHDGDGGRVIIPFSSDDHMRAILAVAGLVTAGAKFSFGAPVQRGNFANGRPPAYRFPSTICGWYLTPSGNLGYAVASIHEPGCIQIFAESALEAREATNNQATGGLAS